VTSSWYCYNANWTDWAAISPNGADPFPTTGPIVPKYDYAGADAAIRVLTEASRYTPGASNSVITWTAAANAVWVLFFTAGGVVNCIYCAGLILAHTSADEYFGPGTGRNVGLAALMAAPSSAAQAASTPTAFR